MALAIDGLIVLIYFVGIVSLGLYAGRSGGRSGGRREKSLHDFATRIGRFSLLIRCRMYVPTPSGRFRSTMAQAWPSSFATPSATVATGHVA